MNLYISDFDIRASNFLVLHTRQVFLRTYDRSFAEFLNEESPVRLRLLDVPTCFGFSTDAGKLILEVFLERWLCGIYSDESEHLFTPAARP